MMIAITITVLGATGAFTPEPTSGCGAAIVVPIVIPIPPVNHILVTGQNMLYLLDWSRVSHSRYQSDANRSGSWPRFAAPRGRRGILVENGPAPLLPCQSLFPREAI